MGLSQEVPATQHVAVIVDDRPAGPGSMPAAVDVLPSFGRPTTSPASAAGQPVHATPVPLPTVSPERTVPTAVTPEPRPASSPQTPTSQTPTSQRPTQAAAPAQPAQRDMPPAAPPVEALSLQVALRHEQERANRAEAAVVELRRRISLLERELQRHQSS